MNFLWILYSPIRLLIIITFTPVTFIFYLSLILIVLPLFIFRKLLQAICRIRDPSIYKIVNTMGHILSRDFSNWQSSPDHSIVVILKFGGQFTLSQMRDLFLQTWILRLSPTHRNRVEYPELQQFFTKRCGYLFYKWDTSFHIDNHVQMYEDPQLIPSSEKTIVDDNILIQIWEKMLTAPYTAKRSPWNVYLLHNYVSNDGKPQDIFILRLHHSLCDGAATYKLLLSLTDRGVSKLDQDIKAFLPKPWYFSLLVNLQAVICGPTSILVKLTKGVDNYNPIHRPLENKTGKCHLSMTTIEISTIKSISKMNKVSYHSVLTAALTGGIRNYLISNGHSLPLSPIRIGLPIPKPGHTNKLRNEYLVAALDLPVRIKTPKDRLTSVEKRLQALRTDSFTAVLSQGSRILGFLPSKLVRSITSKSSVSLMYSEMKAPQEGLKITHENTVRPLEDLMFSFGLGTDDTGLTFNSISYNGKCHFVLGMDLSLGKSRENVKQLMTLIEKELDCFKFGDVANL